MPKIKIAYPKGYSKIDLMKVDVANDRGLVFVDVPTNEDARRVQSIQFSNSSAASEECAWLRCKSQGWGPGGPGAGIVSEETSIHLNREDCKRIAGILLAFSEGGDRLWSDLRTWKGE